MVPWQTPAALAIDCIVVSPPPARAARATSSSRWRFCSASAAGLALAAEGASWRTKIVAAVLLLSFLFLPILALLLWIVVCIVCARRPTPQHPAGQPSIPVPTVTA